MFSYFYFSIHFFILYIYVQIQSNDSCISRMFSDLQLRIIHFGHYTHCITAIYFINHTSGTIHIPRREYDGTAEVIIHEAQNCLLPFGRRGFESVTAADKSILSYTIPFFYLLLNPLCTLHTYAREIFQNKHVDARRLEWALQY